MTSLQTGKTCFFPNLNAFQALPAAERRASTQPMSKKTKMEAISNVVFNFADFRCDIGWLFIIAKFIAIFNDAENDFFSIPVDRMQ